MKGTLERLMKLESGYGIGVLTAKGEEAFVITSSGQADRHLINQLKDKEMVKRVSKKGTVFYRPGRNVELTVEFGTLRQGEEALFADRPDFKIKQRVITVEDAFNWDPGEDFVPCEDPELPPPA